MKQDNYYLITDKQSIPSNVAGTGTISTHGLAIVGTGTAFQTELLAGSYLVVESAWEIRRVVRVDSDTLAFLEVAFTTDIVATAPSIISKAKANPVEIDLKTSDVILLDNSSFTGILNISKSSRDRSSRRDLLEPVMVDATGGSLAVNVLY